jgi:hypothetical protein
MKKFILVMALVFALAAPAFAGFNATKAWARVNNNYNFPVYCTGQVYGQTYSGIVLNSWFNGWVHPGAYAYAYVYTNQMDPFVNAWNDIYCN